MDMTNVVIGILTVILSVIALLNGWFALTIKSLQASDMEIAKEVAALRVLVAGEYVKRGEFQEAMRAQTSTFHEAMRANATAILGAIERLEKHQNPTHHK